MNWTSPTTSTVVGSSHSTRTFRCTHWALFRVRRILLPSSRLSLMAPLADASALVAGMDQAAYRMSCRPARCGPSESSRVFRPAVNCARPSLVAA
jgi:hypothetical protein